MPGSWNARWISFGQDPRDDLGAFVFRRDFESDGGGLAIRVSADQRYRLYFNGVFVGEGPARGDLAHWPYETYQLETKPGANRLEALVWSFGRYAPMAQSTYRLGFVLDGLGISTPDEWLVGKVEGREFAMLDSEVGPFYIDVGPGEIVDLTKLEPLSWSRPNEIGRALELGEWHGDSPWFLVPRAIPAIVRSRWPGSLMVVEPTTNARRPFEPTLVAPDRPVLLDFGELVCGYPRIQARGPGILTVTYGEALFGANNTKGNRDDVVGKRLRGYQDRFHLPAHETDSDPTLWWRTFRYVKVESDRPLQLIDFGATETGYPYEVESRFEASDPWIERLWEVAVRTVRRCAGETYFDCPYYEQLQYVGDTRIQALIHNYLSRDRRLSRQAVAQFEQSITPEGLTQSRYPSRVAQIIPGFSLWWILELLDQADYDTGFDDAEAWKRRKSIAESVLRAYAEGLDHWPFLDWAPEWSLGIPPGGKRHPAAVALYELARLACERIPGEQGRYPKALEAAKAPPTEHEEALQRLVASAKGQIPDAWKTGPYSAKCSLYFQYYKHLAMRPADYLAELGPWRRMIEDGLTTFAETEEPTRSDCHAWSAHPILGFFQIVAGVTSAAPGWRRARIEPRPGQLESFSATIAHPSGDLTVELSESRLRVKSPVPFDLKWQGRQSSYEPGNHSIG